MLSHKFPALLEMSVHGNGDSYVVMRGIKASLIIFIRILAAMSLD